MSGLFDVMNGIWLDRKLDEWENGTQEERARRINEERQRAMAEEFDRRREIIQAEREEYEYKKQQENLKIKKQQLALQQAVKEAEEALNDILYLAYIINTDKTGYLRALSKAKQVFRGINPKDPFCGMRNENGGVNEDFVGMVEEFYLETRKNLKKYDYQLAKYNYLRDVLIEEFEGDEEYYTEEYAKNVFNLSRKEMFDKLKRNEVVWAYGVKTNLWNISKIENYKKYASEGKARMDYPIAS